MYLWFIWTALPLHPDPSLSSPPKVGTCSFSIGILQRRHQPLLIHIVGRLLLFSISKYSIRMQHNLKSTIPFERILNLTFVVKLQGVQVLKMLLDIMPLKGISFGFKKNSFKYAKFT